MRHVLALQVPVPEQPDAEYLEYRRGQQPGEKREVLEEYLAVGTGHRHDEHEEGHVHGR